MQLPKEKFIHTYIYTHTHFRLPSKDLLINLEPMFKMCLQLRTLSPPLQNYIFSIHVTVFTKHINKPHPDKGFVANEDSKKYALKLVHTPSLISFSVEHIDIVVLGASWIIK